MLRELDVDLERWDPWTPSEVAHRLRDVTAPWCVLAGWALDLFLGEQTREHADIEIGAPASRFTEISDALRGLELVVVGDGRAWALSEAALERHFQTWVRDRGGPWRLDVVREEWVEDDWVFRRDPRLRLPRQLLIARTPDGIPFIQPEVALLFKAKTPRPKDEHDFAVVLPRLDTRRRSWLRDALALVHPGHPWVHELGSR